MIPEKIEIIKEIKDNILNITNNLKRCEKIIQP